MSLDIDIQIASLKRQQAKVREMVETKKFAKLSADDQKILKDIVIARRDRIRSLTAQRKALLTVTAQEKKSTAAVKTILDKLATVGPIHIPTYDPMGEPAENIYVELPRAVFNISGTMVLKTTGDTARISRAALDPTIHDLRDEKKYPSTVIKTLLDNLIPTSGGNVGHESNIDEAWIEDITIKKVARRELKHIRMRNTAIIYPHKLLGDVSALSVNSGYCVIDYIVAEFLKRGKRLLRTDLIMELGGEEAIKDGVSSEMIYEWAEQRCNISMYALDPYGNMFMSLKAQSHCDVLLVYIVNNNHVFPVLDDSVKQSVAKSKKLVMAEFAMTADWNDIKEWTPNDSLIPPFPNKTVLVDVRDLGDLATAITKKTGQFVYNVVIPEGQSKRATMFEHPVTGQVIVAAPEWEKRKALLERLIAKDHYLGYVWKNQTWGLIARTMFERKFGTYKPSVYGPQLLKIYEHSTLKPLVLDTLQDLNELDSKGRLSVDTVRCYTAILVNNTDKLPCFSVTDQVEAAGGDWHVGEYYISKRFTMMNIVYPADWYPMPFVREVVKRNYVEKAHVTHMLRASNYYDRAAFASFASDTHKEFPDESKHMINHLVGYWGKQMKRITQGCVTSEWDVASAMINAHENIHVHERDGLCFLRKYTETRLTEGFLPIWRYVIAMSILNLDDMHRGLVGPNTIVYGYNTDSIKLKNPKPFTRGKAPGDYRVEHCSIRGNSVVSNTDGWVPEELKWKDGAIGDSCLVPGPPGSGKTHQLLSIAARYEKRLIVGYTKRTAENINARKAVGAITLDAAFPKDKPNTNYKDLDVMLIDEFSMVKPHHMAKLWKAKYYNNTPMYFFGDTNQTPPIQDNEQPYNRVNYEECALMYYMTGGNRCRLQYLGARYDSETKVKLDTLLRTNTIEWGDKKLWPAARMTLCKLPTTRLRVNKQRFETESKGKELFTVDGCDWFEGMPIIAYSNDKKLNIVNSNHYVVVKQQEGYVLVSNSVGISKIPDKSMNKLFRYGWCDTIPRVQCGEIDYPYNIVDIEHMNRNDLNTAVSRTTKWEYIGVDTELNRTKYLPVKYDFQCRLIEPKSEIEECVIYEKRDEKGKLFYIGRTNNEVAREEQHKRKPTNKDMEAALAKPYTTTVVARWICTPKQIDQLETTMIHDALARGEDLLNKKKVKTPEVKQTITHQVIITKYPIHDDVTKKRLYIKWGKKSKEWGYARCGRPAAYAKAEEFQRELQHSMLL
jgi:hypothetical protein